MKQPNRSATAGTIDPRRLEKLIGSLTAEEKAALTTGLDAWHPAGAEPIGLGPLLAIDGPNGVRAVGLPPGSTATCFPCGTALGATWDVELVRQVAARLGQEARRAGVHYLLGPVLNLVRSPLGGRVFESFGEDPILVAAVGAAYVQGLQSSGVAACPKHFVANDAETHRTTVDCRVDGRTLREVYLVPFEAAARAGAWSIMAAYNLVNGIHCADHMELVRGVLKGEWGWDGVLISDWHAADDTVRCAAAGLDLEMPGPERFFGRHLAAAVRDGRVPESTLDDQARRILRLAARVGALPAGPGQAPAAGPDPSLDPSRPWHLSDAGAAALVRRAAAESFVLLANDGILPLAPAGLRRVAVVGPGAARPCIQGGGSAHISAPPPVTPLDGLKAALPGVEVVHEQGCRIDRFLPPIDRLPIVDLAGEPGLTLEFFAGQEPAGEPFATRHLDSAEMHFFGDLPAGLPEDDFSVLASCRFTPAESGTYEIAIRGFGGRRLKIDGAVVADLWSAPAAADIPTALFEGREDSHAVELHAGKPVLVQAEMHSAAHAPYLLAIGCRPPHSGDRIEAAAEAAAASDVAVVVVGDDETWESEGRDRATTTLPGRQDELVEAVAAANPRTIVVVNAGCPMSLPWADRVAAVIYAWLPGQEFGNALADVLLGLAEPGGRLPFTIAASERDYPALSTTPDANDRLVYAEGVNVGYRHFDAAEIEPRFCFGHGLGYTRIAFESIEMDEAPGGVSWLRIRLRNVGDRAGKAVVQVYLSDEEASVPRPPRELKRFAVVRLDPGETVEVALDFDDRDLAFWDEESASWRVEPGQFALLVGASSRDIRLRASLTV